MILRICLAAALLAATAVPALAQTKAERALHESLIVLDTHFDTPANLSRDGWNIMDRHDVLVDGSQVDYPRMVAGGVDGGFFAIYTPQGQRGPDGDLKARDAALVRGLEIHEMVAAHPDVFEIALTPDQALDIARRGKRFVFISMENGNPFGRDLSLMKTFYAYGVRLMGPVHFMNNELGDSSTDPRGPEWGGLSPLGKQFVAEANRMGVVLDASHASDGVLDDMLALSKAPILLSHSGVKAIYNHPRNIDDAHLKALAAHGGVIQINAFSNYMIAQPHIPERDAAMGALIKRMTAPGKRTEAQTVALFAAKAEIDKKWPVPRATFDDFMKHMLHAIEVAGIDHVGVSGDFDGGGGLDGLDDVTAYPKITAALLKAGYSKDDIAKVWGGNALRVVREAQALAEKPAR
ncbi:MAG: peptidase [Phenylobacterium sp.]|uniref:dipeptidase n=1 Tax=Phenylobacterium sp. TaxID=1871053 RepID=UPI002634A6BE|nr:dipeptidase [Phenylobacterium sp.]MDB5498678.1 peptidase [Phenylobacterium sp.]